MSTVTIQSVFFFSFISLLLATEQAEAAVSTVSELWFVFMFYPCSTLLLYLHSLVHSTLLPAIFLLLCGQLLSTRRVISVRSLITDVDTT